ncbi:hypothetical protein TrVFT333_002588 [Trichoderma virens FT-333]|nr:hypothetical protein TrVFT333_002588 [Trichoderma virens FT-333]
MVGDGKVAMKPFLSPEKEYDWNFDGIYDEPITISIMNIKKRDILVKVLARYDMLPLGQSLLSWAAENGYNALIRFLLIKERLDPNTKGDSGRTPLSQASENGHEMAVRILLMDGRTNLNLNDDDSRTPISQAAEKGHELIVRLLLGKRATAISKTEMEWENEEERELFLTRDWANPNLKDNSGHTALSRAIENGHSAIVTLLAPIDTVTIFMMVQEGNRRAIKSLFDAKSNLDEQSGQGHTPLHAAILSGKLEIAKDLLSYGVRTNLQDSDNMTPLRLAMQQKDGRFIRELLKHKATMNGIMANEWRDSFDQEDEDIILFSEKENGEIHMDFVIALPTANEMSKQPSETPHHSPWSKVPITGSTQQLRPNELYISIPKTASDMQSDISVSLWLSIENYLTSSSSTSSAANTYRIAWKMIRSTKPGSPWTSTVYFSTLPNGWMPENEMDLFKQFIFYVKGNWLRLCQHFETHLSKRRLEQLNCKGKTPDMIDLLANDALKLAELRSILHDQVRAAEKFINEYCRYFNANKIPQGLLEGLTEEFELAVNKQMGQLDQVIRDLLQIEFAWASINEARISTQLGQNVMLLTYVSIFYLPLGFCAALWAIPNITNSSTRTPFIATSIIVGLITLLITFNMERISGVVKRVIHYGKGVMAANMLGDGGQNECQDEIDSRKEIPKARFGDSIMAITQSITGKKEQQKQNMSKV